MSSTSSTTPPVTAIVTDIEGTTTDIAFVKECLFPYASQNLAHFITTHGHQPEVQKHLQEVSHLAQLDVEDRPGQIQTLLHWIETDQKITPLKALQGLIWSHAYQTGSIKGHLYTDAYQNLLTWAQKYPIYIYSSGSVKAQKLLFSYSIFGDITSKLSGYFDTTTGPKKVKESYLQIVDALQKNANEVLFLSDHVEELQAADEAGLQTAELRRDQQAASERYPSFSNFDQVSDYFSL